MDVLDWYDIVGRLALAVVLGGVLGLEREYSGQDAGFRTHVLVVLGSALFGLMSVGGFDAFIAERATTNVAVDVTRLAAYVAPGIGFIGGGAILKYGGRVTGITTAASLWSAAAIGVAAGVGVWFAAVAAAALSLLALALQPVSRMASERGLRRRAAYSIEVAADADLGRVIEEVRAAVQEPVRALRFGVGPGDHGHLTVECWGRSSRHVRSSVVERLSSLEGVIAVDAAAAGE